MQQLLFDALMFVSLQEVEHERLFHLELVKDEHVNLAVSTLATLITSIRSNEAVAAENSVVEAMIQIAGFADIEYLIIRDEEIDPSDLKRSNVEAAEGANTEAMQRFMSFILNLGIELERMTQSISIRNERLNEQKTKTAQDENIINVMRFWAKLRELPGYE